MEHNIEDMDDVEVAALTVLAIPLVAVMSVVGPALIVGSIVLLIDGTVANYQKDLMVMILVSALSLVSLGVSLRAFNRARKGGSSVSIVHKYLTLILPILWCVGMAGGYLASTDIIKTQNRRSTEHAIYVCEDLMEQSDIRWVKCLAAVPVCNNEANHCKKVGSAEEVKACTDEFSRRRSSLNKNDLLKIEEPSGNYIKELNKICLFESIND